MSFIEHFSIIEDRRTDINIKHRLIDILFLTLCGILSGAEGWEEISEFGKQKQTWLKKFLGYDKGIPSASTIKRVISLIEAETLLNSYINWINSIREQQDLTIIAIDGKTLKQSYQNSDDKLTALHSISAYATEEGITLTLTDSKTKKNEIQGVLELIEILELKSTIITADAMSCNKKITKAITDKQGDYVLQLKATQSKLLAEVKAYFHKIRRDEPNLIEQGYHENIDAGHGRIETRQCTQLAISDWIENAKEWTNLNSIIEIVRIRHDKKTGEQTTQTAYYISSLSINPEQLNYVIKRHWAIENSLHYVLDVTFKEDSCRIREQQATKNMALFRRASVSLIKSSGIKGSVKSIVKRCGLNHDILEQVVFGKTFVG